MSDLWVSTITIEYSYACSQPHAHTHKTLVLRSRCFLETLYVATVFAIKYVFFFLLFRVFCSEAIINIIYAYDDCCCDFLFCFLSFCKYRSRLQCCCLVFSLCFYLLHHYLLLSLLTDFFTALIFFSIFFSVSLSIILK